MGLLKLGNLLGVVVLHLLELVGKILVVVLLRVLNSISHLLPDLLESFDGGLAIGILGVLLEVGDLCLLLLDEVVVLLVDLSDFFLDVLLHLLDRVLQLLVQLFEGSGLLGVHL